MNCDDCVEHLYTFLDGELTAETEAAVRLHLQTCADCNGHFEFERTFLSFLEAKAKVQGCPDHVKRRIFEEILKGKKPQ